MQRLFVYGSLQPGGPNEHVLAAIGGEWQAAVVRGVLIEVGWGARIGFPGMLIDDEGDEIAGHVFSSPRLAAFWDELDAFEGPEYERQLTVVTLQDGSKVSAHAYVLRTRPRK